MKDRDLAQGTQSRIEHGGGRSVEIESTDTRISQDLIDREVGLLLSQLTLTNFDALSDEIISWANKSDNEGCFCALNRVVHLLFEAAVGDSSRSTIFARLSRKMMERVSPKVQDRKIVDARGKPRAGGQLFRFLLLKRCQGTFENTVVGRHCTPDVIPCHNAQEVTQQLGCGEGSCTGQRRNLGLVMFIGELFLLQMLTDRIMHALINGILFGGESSQNKIECLCALLETVGASIDTPKARAHMDIYFSGMKELSQRSILNPDVQIRLQVRYLCRRAPLVFDILTFQSFSKNILKLRDRKWVPPPDVNSPGQSGALLSLMRSVTCIFEAVY